VCCAYDELVMLDQICDELGLVLEMEESSGWKRIEGDFGKFRLIVEIPPPQCPSFPFIPLIPKQALSDVKNHVWPINHEDFILFTHQSYFAGEEALGAESEHQLMASFHRKTLVVFDEDEIIYNDACVLGVAVLMKSQSAHT
jgi:hypothetical protein